MKTGTAIALAIGVPVTIGVIAWAVLANKIVDKIDDVPSRGFSGGGGSRGNAQQPICGTIIVDEASSLRLAANLDTSGISGDSSAALVLIRMMQAAFPECTWSMTTVATIITASGEEVEWAEIMSMARGKTIAQFENDPAAYALMHGGRENAGPEGAGTTMRALLGVSP